MIRFVKALLEWLFVYHGYYRYKGLSNGTPLMLVQIQAENRLFGKKLREQKCKQCGNNFWAFKRNDTCSNIGCFFGYRLKGE